MADRKLNAAVLQASGKWAAFNTRLAELDTLLTANPALDLLACPELFVSGYFLSVEQCQQAAEPADGRYREAIGALAARHQTAIVYGYPEATDDAIYNAAACVDTNGTLIANHRKLALPPGIERELYACGRQHTMCSINGFRCALLICYDAEFPENVRAAALAGAEVLIVPTALTDRWPGVAQKMMPTRAFENGVWLLYANGAADTTSADNRLRLAGLSAILQPDGLDAARADTQPSLITASIDLASIHKARTRLPYFEDIASLPH